MLPGNDALNALLDLARNDTTVELYPVELYTFQLSGGSGFIRWTSADQDISYGGYTWVRGPGISRSQISRQTGTQAGQLDLTLYFDDTILVNGVKVASFIASGGLFNSIFRLDRGYAPSPSEPIVGTLPKFAGRVTQLKNTGETQATISVSNWMSLLNVQVPVNVWQPPCLHTVFDAGCTLNRNDFAKTGVVQGGSDKITVFTDLVADAGYFDLGKITFTSGDNNGQSRTIKSQGGGILSLIRALPSVPAPGDKFTVYPGCDLTQATCTTKFNNVDHFKGMPFVPTVETAAP